MRLGDFTEQASAYATARPDYPERLVDRLVEVAGVSAGDEVADIGAGTGIFSAQLAQRGLKVTAIDPNEAMRRSAPLGKGIVWRDGSFEETGMPTGSMKWVTAAQAFHWADPPRALPEMRRVLRRAGAFTVLWNNRDNAASPVLTHSCEVIRAVVPEFDEAYRELDYGSVLLSTEDFVRVIRDEERHVVAMSRERYLNLWRSHNRLSVTAGPERSRKILKRIESWLDAERLDKVDVPYVCTAWTAFRE
jgi:ubiquinone/menaquinone biosynthesis C-methylase UbiE